jgi:hypothetical protein
VDRFPQSLIGSSNEEADYSEIKMPMKICAERSATKFPDELESRAN